MNKISTIQKVASSLRWHRYFDGVKDIVDIIENDPEVFRSGISFSVTILPDKNTLNIEFYVSKELLYTIRFYPIYHFITDRSYDERLGGFYQISGYKYDSDNVPKQD